MKLSDAGLEALQREEGTVLHVYDDQVGIATTCTGHVVQPDDHSWIDDGITREECRDILRADVARFEAAVDSAVRVPLTQPQFDALVSLAFNIGATAFAKSTLVLVLNQAAYLQAADHFMDWRNAGGKPILLARRNRERVMFLSGLTAPAVPVAESEIPGGIDPAAELEAKPEPRETD